MASAAGAGGPATAVPAPAFWGLDPQYWSFAKVHIGTILHAARMAPAYAGVFWAGPGPNSDRPLRTVHVVGTVVSIEVKSSRVAYSIDDGTGVIGAVLWQKIGDLDRTAAAGGHLRGGTHRLRLRGDSDAGGGAATTHSDMADAVDRRVRLGTTVRCQGKLQLGNAEFSRSELGGGAGSGGTGVAVEISVYRLQPVQDPNEEPLHWLQCEQLWESEYARHAAAAHYSQRRVERTLAQMAAGPGAARGHGGTGRSGAAGPCAAVFEDELDDLLARRIAVWLSEETDAVTMPFSTLVATPSLRAAVLDSIGVGASSSGSGSGGGGGGGIFGLGLSVAAAAAVVGGRGQPGAAPSQSSAREAPPSSLLASPPLVCRGGVGGGGSNSNSSSSSSSSSSRTTSSLPHDDDSSQLKRARVSPLGVGDNGSDDRGGGGDGGRAAAGSCSLSPVQVEALVKSRFRVATRELRQKGYVFLSDPDADEYTLLSEKRFLEPRVLACLAGQQQPAAGDPGAGGDRPGGNGAAAAAEGTSVAEVYAEMQRQRPTARVSFRRVEQCMATLLDDSRIFEVTPGCFQLV